MKPIVGVMPPANGDAFVEASLVLSMLRLTKRQFLSNPEKAMDVAIERAIEMASDKELLGWIQCISAVEINLVIDMLLGIRKQFPEDPLLALNAAIENAAGIAKKGSCSICRMERTYGSIGGFTYRDGNGTVRKGCLGHNDDRYNYKSHGMLTGSLWKLHTGNP